MTTKQTPRPKLCTLEISGSGHDTIMAEGLPASQYFRAKVRPAWQWDTLDDSPEYGAIPSDGEYDCCADHSGLYGIDLVRSCKERMRIIAVYNGGWSFAIGMVYEYDDMPPWDIAIDFDSHSRTSNVRITLPEDTRCIWLGKCWERD